MCVYGMAKKSFIYCVMCVPIAAVALLSVYRMFPCLSLGEREKGNLFALHDKGESTAAALLVSSSLKKVGAVSWTWCYSLCYRSCVGRGDNSSCLYIEST